ncbi:MAG: EAL domain-containing protein [Synergistaceae bacterium]|nr:EAL domain-containing protein [Synergistaceae bacterium]
MPGGFFVYKADESEEIIFANDEFIKIFECEDFDDFIKYTGGTFYGVVHPDDLRRVQAQIVSQINSPSNQDRFDYVQYRIKTKTGRVRYIEDFGRHITTKSCGDLFYVFAVDLKDKLDKHDVDSLTGLLNRESFLNQAQLILKNLNKADKLGMAFVWFNIDNFKLYNKRFGFDRGNDLLREAAYELASFFPDGIISRFADDHFVVFTTLNYKQEGLEAEFELDEIQRRLSALNKDAALRFRAGIYLPSYNEDEDAATACDRAKLACDRIKNNHSLNYCVYQENLTRSLIKYQDIIDALDNAIINENIKIYYQPIVRLLNGRVCELEALTRWNDDKLGFISPGDFIPALEKYHDIHKLDIFMINQVCKDYKLRSDKGLPLLPVSINLSRLDFELCDIFNEIEKAVNYNRMPKNMLKIEITESIDLRGEDLNILRLGIEKFKLNGYEVWMDDFGSGYSSLNVLKDYNFDTIKFDMKFLSDFGTSDKSKFIINSNLSMAKQMGIQSLAEGVETSEQLEYLKSIGFEKAQGYLFSKPAPLDEIFNLKNLKIEDLRDTQYYEELGGIDLPNQENMQRTIYSSIKPFHYTVADIKPMALIEIRGGVLSFLASNDVFREKILELDFNNNAQSEGEIFKHRLLKSAGYNSKRNGQNFSTFVNCERFNVSMTPIAHNKETNAEAYLIICESN